MDTPRNTSAPDWKEEKQENHKSEYIEAISTQHRGGSWIYLRASRGAPARPRPPLPRPQAPIPAPPPPPPAPGGRHGLPGRPLRAVPPPGRGTSCRPGERPGLDLGRGRREAWDGAGLGTTWEAGMAVSVRLVLGSRPEVHPPPAARSRCAAPRAGSQVRAYTLIEEILGKPAFSPTLLTSSTHETRRRRH